MKVESGEEHNPAGVGWLSPTFLPLTRPPGRRRVGRDVGTLGCQHLPTILRAGMPEL